MLSKKAELPIVFSVWWFFVIFVIGAGIAVSVAIYYSAEVDVRWLESDILGERILNCVVDNGYLVEGAFDNESFYRDCSLNRGKFGRGSNYFFKVWVDSELKIGGGDYSVEKNCDIKKKMIYTTKYFPICSEKRIVILDSEGNSKILRILAGSKQLGRIESNF